MFKLAITRETKRHSDREVSFQRVIIIVISTIKFPRQKKFLLSSMAFPLPYCCCRLLIVTHFSPYSVWFAYLVFSDIVNCFSFSCCPLRRKKKHKTFHRIPNANEIFSNCFFFVSSSSKQIFFASDQMYVDEINSLKYFKRFTYKFVV